MSADCDLTSYAELADVLENLPMLVREKRRRDRLSLHRAGALVGCAASTLMRFEKGENGIALDTAAALVRWLGAAPPTA